MGRYTITRHIAAQPKQVFRAFTAPDMVADWLDASEVRGATGSLDTTGTRYTLVIRGPWKFRTQVFRSEPPLLHETVGRAPLGGWYRFVATLTPREGATDLDLLTAYTVPLGAVGRWIDRRWIDREPRTQANREVDRLVELVTGRSLELAEPGQ